MNEEKNVVKGQISGGPKIIAEMVNLDTGMVDDESEEGDESGHTTEKPTKHRTTGDAFKTQTEDSKNKEKEFKTQAEQEDSKNKEKESKKQAKSSLNKKRF